MSKKIIIAFLAISCYLSFAIIDFSNNYRIAFKTHDLSNDLLSVDSGQILGNGAGYIEIVWNTGDTGSTIIIDTPGVYIVSVKDVWRIKKGAADGFTIYDTVYQKGVFIKGYPDGVRIDTITISGVQPYINTRQLRTYTLIDNGRVYQQTFRDTAWTDGVNSYWTETHPVLLGFWSGKLDTIIIQEQRLPIMVNAKVMTQNNHILSGKRWRVMQ